MNRILMVLDNFFKDKSENEKWMIIFLITLVIGYLSYSLFLPYAEDKYHKSIAKKRKLEQSIMKNKQYIASITINGDRDFYIKKYDKDIKNLEDGIKKINLDINYISSKLEELSPLLFNKESWSRFLDSITREARDQKVKIDYINNEYVDGNGSFGHVLEISVGCVGGYRSIAKFINKLEKSVLVTDIYQMSIRLDENKTTNLADINVSVWGINH